jgi:hypothetical protein
MVMELPTGQMLHVWKDGKLHLKKSRYAMQVLYDPVGSEQLHHVYQDGRVTMQFVGKAAGTEVDFLFGSGASTNYVSSAFARMYGLTVKPVILMYVWAQGTVSLPKASALYISSWVTIKTEWNAMFLIW